MELFEELSLKVKGKDVKIVFPEGDEPRIIGAAVRLLADGLCKPILLGNVDQINEVANARGFNISHLEIIDPEEEDAQKLLRDVTYFGTMMVYMGLADGLVSGAVHSTGDTVRPALQIIKTKPGVSRTSGAFIMINSDKSKKYLFSDCAININPNAQELAEIAVESAKTAELFGIEPNVAMLSFSTKGSAKSEEALKVAEATKIAQELAPNYNIDGELQFDAAFVPSVGKQKAPDSPVAGQATVFVFPEIQSGNIGYKIAQRFGNFEAIGPILQGLNKPISDLSRGCNEEDVYKLAIITANQALMEN